jgi:hypothetical protein
MRTRIRTLSTFSQLAILHICRSAGAYWLAYFVRLSNFKIAATQFFQYGYILGCLMVEMTYQRSLHGAANVSPIEDLT